MTLSSVLLKDSKTKQLKDSSFCRRTLDGTDSGLLARYAGTVSVHMYNGTQAAVTEWHSFLQASLIPGQSYSDSQYTKTKFTFVSRTGNFARWDSMYLIVIHPKE